MPNFEPNVGPDTVIASFALGLLLASPPCVCCYVFVHAFLFNPHFDLEPDYNFSHTSQSAITTSFCPLKRMQTQMPKNARNSPFHFRHVDFHLTHECLGPTHSPCQTTARSLYALPHNGATKSTLVRMGCHTFTPKTAPSPLTITTKI